jgi:hypothetical protein
MGAVQLAQGGRRELGSGHGDKGVPARLMGGGIKHQMDLGDGPGAREQKPEVGFTDVWREVADMEFGVHQDLTR